MNRDGPTKSSAQKDGDHDVGDILESSVKGIVSLLQRFAVTYFRLLLWGHAKVSRGLPSVGPLSFLVISTFLLSFVAGETRGLSETLEGDFASGFQDPSLLGMLSRTLPTLVAILLVLALLASCVHPRSSENRRSLLSSGCYATGLVCLNLIPAITVADVTWQKHTSLLESYGLKVIEVMLFVLSLWILLPASRVFYDRLREHFPLVSLMPWKIVFPELFMIPSFFISVFLLYIVVEIPKLSNVMDAVSARPDAPDCYVAAYYKPADSDFFVTVGVENVTPHPMLIERSIHIVWHGLPAELRRPRTGTIDAWSGGEQKLLYLKAGDSGWIRAHFPIPEDTQVITYEKTWEESLIGINYVLFGKDVTIENRWHFNLGSAPATTCEVSVSLSPSQDSGEPPQGSARTQGVTPRP